jgi:hypothetical protein
MEDFAAPPPECGHKFKQRADGMLVCELCGFARPPSGKQPPQAVHLESIGGEEELDCSKGAKFMRSQRRIDRIFDAITEILWWT